MKISELVSALESARDAYYNDVEIMSDEEFDILEQELKKLDPNNPYFETIGSDVRGGKIDLPIPMGGLEQVYEGDTEKWIKSNNWEDEDFIISDKQDGISGLNVYGKSGKFSIAYSRGNGYQGADISRHIKRMKVFTKSMPEPCIIREEIIVENSAFEDLQEQWESNSQYIYKNPRAYVSGKMNSEKTDKEFLSNVKVIATSVIEPSLSKEDQFIFLEDNGFEVTPYIKVKGRDLTDKFLSEYLEERKRLSPTAIDGLVIDLNSKELREDLDDGSLTPSYSRKFKIGTESATARVEDVEWNISKHGFLKPRVKIVPTSLNGVTISYLTGFNAKFINENNIGKGAIIEITRSGDVIPYIKRVIKGETPLLPTESDFGEMIWSENNVDLILISKDNNDIIVNILNDAFGPTGLNIPNFRKGNIEKMVEAGFATIESIVKADKATLVDIIGPHAGEIVFENIKKNLNPIEIHKLAALSQKFGRGMGKRRLVKIEETLGEKFFYKATISDIISVEGFEEKTATQFVNNIPTFRKFLEDLVGYYHIKTIVNSGKFSGINFIFTGYRDKEAEAYIVEHGGKIQSTVNKDTTYLVTKDTNSKSSKAEKARKLGINILNPMEFKAILNGE